MNPNKLIILFCLIFFLCIVSVVFSEEAAEKKKPKEPPVKWSGFVEGGGTVQHGNTRTKQLTLGAELIRTTKKTKLLSKGFLAYGETDNVKTRDNYYGIVKFDYFLSRKFYGYLSLEVQSDEFRDLKLRTIASGGGGLELIKNEKHYLAGALGVASLKENFEAAEDDRRSTARSEVKYKWSFQPKSSFNNNCVLFTGLTENKYQIRNEASFSFTLMKHLGLRCGHIWQYENKPSSGFKKADSTYFFNIQYKF